MLRNCLWCGILYRVRDPGDSRRASLKRLKGRHSIQGAQPSDPGDSRRASLKATHRTAGGWKSSRMVAHYAAAVAAEQGAVATYL